MPETNSTVEQQTRDHLAILRNGLSKTPDGIFAMTDQIVKAIMCGMVNAASVGLSDNNWYTEVQNLRLREQAALSGRIAEQAYSCTSYLDLLEYLRAISSALKAAGIPEDKSGINFSELRDKLPTLRRDYIIGLIASAYDESIEPKARALSILVVLGMIGLDGDSGPYGTGSDELVTLYRELTGHDPV